MKIVTILPALNEEASLPGVLNAIPAHVQAVVVDNGSTDRTAGVARAAGATVLHEPKRGYGTAVLAGMARLASDPPDIVVILDADHADYPELMDRLTGPITADQADFVLSDRTISAEPGALTPQQRAGNALATALIARATGFRYRDMGPFRAIRWSSLMQLAMSDPTWGWNVEMQMKAVLAGLRIQEVSMPYRCRRAGESKISGTLVGTVRAGYRILRAVQRWTP